MYALFPIADFPSGKFFDVPFGSLVLRLHIYNGASFYEHERTAVYDLYFDSHDGTHLRADFPNEI